MIREASFVNSGEGSALLVESIDTIPTNTAIAI
jgi:hypothetical protein